MNHKLTYLLAACLVVAMGCSGAQEPEGTPPAPPTLAIGGATLIDVTGGASIPGCGHSCRGISNPASRPEQRGAGAVRR